MISAPNIVILNPLKPKEGCIFMTTMAFNYQELGNSLHWTTSKL